MNHVHINSIAFEHFKKNQKNKQNKKKTKQKMVHMRISQHCTKLQSRLRLHCCEAMRGYNLYGMCCLNTNIRCNCLFSSVISFIKPANYLFFFSEICVNKNPPNGTWIESVFCSFCTYIFSTEIHWFHWFDSVHFVLEIGWIGSEPNSFLHRVKNVQHLDISKWNRFDLVRSLAGSVHFRMVFLLLNAKCFIKYEGWAMYSIFGMVSK